MPGRSDKRMTGPRQAVLVGINGYSGREGLGGLRFAETDAEDLACELRTRCGFEVRCILGPEATYSGIWRVLREEVGRGQTFIFFFAGHGDAQGTHYRVHPIDSVGYQNNLAVADLRDYITGEGFGFDRVAMILDACRNERVVTGQRGQAVLDARASAAVRDIVREDEDETLVHVLFGCPERGVSYEDPDLGHGLFTWGMLETLRHWSGEVLDLNGLEGGTNDRLRRFADSDPKGRRQRCLRYGSHSLERNIVFLEASITGPGPVPRIPDPPASVPDSPRSKSPPPVRAKPAVAWWVVIDGQERGPLDVAAVQDEIQRGSILRNSTGWREGMADWRPMGELEEWVGLFPLLREAPPVVHPPKRTPSIVLPGFLEPVPDAAYARLGGLNAGSEAAQKLQKQWVEKGYPLEVRIHKTGIALRLVPPGEFLMGSPKDESEASKDERPQYKVTIGSPMYIGTFPVTQEQWLAILGKNPSRIQTGSILKERRVKKSFWSDKETVEQEEVRLKTDTKEHPVESVSWNDCQEFLNRLHDQVDLEFGRVLRLPTEAEWEYACRAGTTVSRYGEVDAVVWHSGNSGGITHRVGQKHANAWGFHDMLGNVYEWCEDNWNADYKNARTDGSAWQGSNSSRVIRGGSFIVDPRYCRSACRGALMPDERAGNLGFRVVCSFEHFQP